jgi:hypothetical protein
LLGQIITAADKTQMLLDTNATKAGLTWKGPIRQAIQDQTVALRLRSLLGELFC